MKEKEDKYRLDRTAFEASTFEEADDAMRDYKNYSIKQRLEIAYYLTSIAYRFDMSNPPKMDKTVFTAEKLSNG